MSQEDQVIEKVALRGSLLFHYFHSCWDSTRLMKRLDPAVALSLFSINGEVM